MDWRGPTRQRDPGLAIKKVERGLPFYFHFYFTGERTAVENRHN